MIVPGQADPGSSLSSAIECHWGDCELVIFSQLNPLPKVVETEEGMLYLECQAPEGKMGNNFD